MRYKCDNCKLKPCCFNLIPINLPDINLFILNGIVVKYLLYNVFNNEYLVFIKQNDNGHCPFFNKYNMCTVYNNRPEYCKYYECKALDKEIEYIKELDNKEDMYFFSLHLKNKNDKLFKHSPININNLPRNIEYEIIDFNKLMRLTNDEYIINNILKRLGG